MRYACWGYVLLEAEDRNAALREIKEIVAVGGGWIGSKEAHWEETETIPVLDETDIPTPSRFSL